MPDHDPEIVEAVARAINPLAFDPAQIALCNCPVAQRNLQSQQAAARMQARATIAAHLAALDKAGFAVVRKDGA